MSRWQALRKKDDAMTRKRTIAAALLIGAVAWIAGGIAVAEMSDTAALQTAATPQTQSLARASELLGKPVKDGSGSVLGQVVEIVLTPDRNAIAYFALARDQQAGRLWPITLNQLRLATDDAALAYSGPPEQLAAMPGFRRGYWPESASAEALAKLEETVVPLVRSPADRTPVSSQPAFARRLASRVIGMGVRDASENSVCQIRDLIVSMDDGHILAATVRLSASFGVQEKLASVPWKAVTMPPSAHDAHVTLSADDLRQAAYPDQEYWRRAGFGKPTAPRIEPAK